MQVVVGCVACIVSFVVCDRDRVQLCIEVVVVEARVKRLVVNPFFSRQLFSQRWTVGDRTRVTAGEPEGAGRAAPLPRRARITLFPAGGSLDSFRLSGHPVGIQT